MTDKDEMTIVWSGTFMDLCCEVYGSKEQGPSDQARERTGSDEAGCR